MKTTVCVSKTFRASHTHPMCAEYLHGHGWFMKVVGPTGTDIGAMVTMLLVELDLRDLNVMVHGTEPTPEGIAAWALERLRPYIPGLVSVSVGFEGYEATVEV